MTKGKYQGIVVEEEEISVQNPKIKLRESDCFEIIYVKINGMRISVGGEKHIAKQGSVIFVRPKETYLAEAVSKKFEIISVKIGMAELWKNDTDSFLLANIGLLANKMVDMQRVYTEEEIVGLENMILECAAEWEKKEKGYELIVKSDVEKILVWMLRRSNCKMLENEANISNDYIKRAIEYLESNLKEVTAADMAEYVGVSYTYFLRLFKEATGCNFVKFSHNIRIQRAQMLLVETNDTLDKIAVEVGFSTTSHFIKVFKGCTGVTPSSYRRQVLYGNK